jgi:outer membrane protein assembly factor BamE (lipoprotein component of BamABCDE complex)
MKNAFPVAAVYDRRSDASSWATVINRRYRETLLLATLVLLTACSSAVSPDKISQIKPDMKVDQVTAILGQPTRIEHAETTQSQGDVYYYAVHNGTGRVIFLNNAVFKAEFVPGAKS